MILMLIDFDDTGLLRAFWGETPQDCWAQFVMQYADELGELDDVDFTNLAYAAEFYDAAETKLHVVCSIQRTVQFT